MNSAQFRVHIEAYLKLRSSLGFQTEYESYNLRFGARQKFPSSARLN
jgi:hypothetical protein